MCDGDDVLTFNSLYAAALDIIFAGDAGIEDEEHASRVVELRRQSNAHLSVVISADHRHAVMSAVVQALVLISNDLDSNDLLIMDIQPEGLAGIRRYLALAVGEVEWVIYKSLEGGYCASVADQFDEMVSMAPELGVEICRINTMNNPNE